MATPALDSAIDDLLGATLELRHDLHRHPEPGFEEIRTQQRLRDELTRMGLTPRDCGGTGLVADVGRGGGRTIALRADIDCLRMTEENPDLPWRSERPGLAHMCGHDGHTATLLGAAELLARAADGLPGTVRLLFQPAEEGPGGAPRMIADGALDGVDEIYGMHNWPAARFGVLNTIAGPCMATVAEFSLVVRGLGGHASMPHDTIDPVVASAHLVTALQTIVSRNVFSKEQAVLSVTRIHGGEAFNVIPQTVTLGGTMRALSESTFTTLERRLREVVEHTCRALGCTADLTVTRMYPVLVNTPDETAHVERVGRVLLGAENVSTGSVPMLGSEDFAYYLEKVPGCFFFLGAGAPGRTNAMCHSTNFDFNDDLLGPGMRFWVRLVEDRLDAKIYA